MNGKTELVVSPVVYLVLAKRHIADGEIVEVFAVGGLKSSHRDIRLGIELPGDAAADAVQLHAVETAAAHLLRQHPEEVADAHRRFQNIAGLKAHVCQRVIHGLNDRGAGVVGIQRGGSGSGVFLVCQELFQIRILCGPGWLVRVKGIGQTAPANILRENMLFLQGRRAVLTFDLL